MRKPVGTLELLDPKGEPIMLAVPTFSRHGDWAVTGPPPLFVAERGYRVTHIRSTSCAAKGLTFARAQAVARALNAEVPRFRKHDLALRRPEVSKAAALVLKRFKVRQ